MKIQVQDIYKSFDNIFKVLQICKLFITMYKLFMFMHLFKTTENRYMIVYMITALIILLIQQLQMNGKTANKDIYKMPCTDPAKSHWASNI